MTIEVFPVIMCGGAGTRLWPMSTKAKPKQFHNIVSDKSMLQETIVRGGHATTLKIADPSFVCSSMHKDLILEQCSQIGVKPHKVILEPSAKNTAAVAAAIALELGDGGGEKLVLLLPADHHITDVSAFWSAIEKGCASAGSGNIVTFGVQPEHPETGYGYIRGGADSGDGSRAIIEFVEKPDLATAKTYLEDGNYFWNAGIFLFRPKDMLSAFSSHAADILETVEAALSEGKRSGPLTYLDAVEFDKCRNESFDYAIMEKAENISLVGPIDIGWNDIGSWRAVSEFEKRYAVGETQSGLNLKDKSCKIDCSDVLIKSTGQFVATVGVSNLAVIATPESVLVINLDASQDVKKVVMSLKDADAKDLI